ncbi:MAG: glycosyltransferase N-terminal domain-containing protein [Pseudomonadota bacterium]
MPLGLFLYKSMTTLIAPFLGALFRRRAKSGKEDAARINERFAQQLPDRAPGQLLWMHAASVGESQLLLELARRIFLDDGHTGGILFTCQTQTAANLISKTIRDDEAFRDKTCVQQMAPVDTSRIMRRFLDHWSPAMAIMAEGEIWPNALLELHARNIPTALLNARMTEKTIRGWLRWPKTARQIFSTLNVIVAADVQTQTGLSELSGKDVTCPGNLKSALPAPSVDEAELSRLEQAIGTRPVLLAASTHPSEEALVVDAWMQMQPKPFLIIAPRHPERGDDVDTLLSMSNAAVSRRSEDDPLDETTEILLADTIGEMGLWYRVADTVYLGGGHAPGVGGHNPIEALQLDKPVLSGPSIFNFRDLSERLLPLQGFSIIHDANELASAFPTPPVSAEMKTLLQADSLGPMAKTLEVLEPVLSDAGFRE